MAKEKKSQQSVAQQTGDLRAAALEKAIEEIEKKNGKGSIMRMGDTPKFRVDVIPTGSLNLDLALGVGGIPRGRIIEIYGPESSGKTTLALHCVAEAQKAGGIAAYIDAEHALDPTYAQNLGVDIENLLISQPDSGEQALSIADALVRSGAIDILIIDSVAALTPRSEIDGEIGDASMGRQARLMSSALRVLSANISKTNTAVIFINQLRDMINTGYGAGPTETTAGGRALKYYASVRIDIRRIGSIKMGENIIGSHTKCRVVKNKVAPPFGTANFDIYFGKGISKQGEVLDVALTMGVIEKSGSWFSFGGERICQGKEHVREMMESDPGFSARVEAAVREKFSEGAVAPADDLAEESGEDADAFILDD
ncbi:MAG: recombinase RecA [Clostridia bacterium]|nr:recombinase RecA [Clostridia bacterium]